MAVTYRSLRRASRIFSVLFLLILLIAGVAYLLLTYDPAGALKTYLEGHVHPLVFLLLMFLLPAAGAPISIFLLLVGMRFGVSFGLLLTGAAMLFHMALTFSLCRLFLKDWIVARLTPLRLTIPQFTASSTWPAFLFMVIPGLPYFLKNILLSLSGLPLRRYLLINWTAQFGMGIPLVILGQGVIEMNPLLLTAAVLLLLLVIFLQRTLGRQQKTEGRGHGEDAR